MVPSDPVHAWLRPACLVLSLLFPMRLHGQAIQLEVQFKLTDLEYHPLAGQKVRVVLGNEDWQAASAGHAFQTDANGEGHFTAPAVLDRRWRRPLGALVSLPGLPEHTVHILAAAELDYGGHRRLHAVDLCRFKNGDVLQDGSKCTHGMPRAASPSRLPTPMAIGAWRI